MELFAKIVNEFAPLKQLKVCSEYASGFYNMYWAVSLCILFPIF